MFKKEVEEEQAEDKQEEDIEEEEEEELEYDEEEQEEVGEKTSLYDVWENIILFKKLSLVG